MATIDFNDVIYVTLTQRGNVIATLTLSGISSVEAIVQQLRGLAKTCAGLVTLQLRNFTKGWSQSRNLLLPKPQRIEAVQLSLF